MTPNWQQLQGALRTLIAVLAGVAVDHGLLSSGDVQRLLDPQLWTAIGTIGGLAIAGWSWWTHRQSNAVAVVAAMPEVFKVQTMNTPAGVQLATDVGSTPQAIVTVAPH